MGQGGTGGGVSDAFAVPAWQTAAGVPVDADTGRPGRGVPDVAADADPATGYQVRVDGTDLVYGGTSAVAPLWAALISRLAEASGQRFGLIQTLLYAGVTAGTAVPGCPAAGTHAELVASDPLYAERAATQFPASVDTPVA